MIRAQAFMLTFAQCDVCIEDIYEAVLAKFAKTNFQLEQLVVAREQHANGDPHVHAFIHLSGGRLAWKLQHFATEIVGVDGDGKYWHPNVSVPKGPLARFVVDQGRYVTKDGFWLALRGVAAATAPTGDDGAPKRTAGALRAAEVVKRLRQGETPVAMLHDDDDAVVGVVAQGWQRYVAIAAALEQKRKAEAAIGWPYADPGHVLFEGLRLIARSEELYPDPAVRLAVAQVVDWLAFNFQPRVRGQKQLCIRSSTGQLKSGLINALERFVSLYRWQYASGSGDTSYQRYAGQECLVFDEFHKGAVALPLMLQLLGDTEQASIRVMASPHGTAPFPLPGIVLTNVKEENLYPGVRDREQQYEAADDEERRRAALFRRWQYVAVPDGAVMAFLPVVQWLELVADAIGGPPSLHPMYKRFAPVCPAPCDHLRARLDELAGVRPDRTPLSTRWYLLPELHGGSEQE